MAAAQFDKQLYTTIGGFHLVQTPREEIERVAGILHDTLRLQRVAPGHCTSEPGFAAFMRKFGDRFDEAGLGDVGQLALAAESRHSVFMSPKPIRGT